MQEGIQDQWQHESPAKEYLEQVQCCKDTDCTPRMMKQGFFALKNFEWEEYKSIFKVEAKATEWLSKEYVRLLRRWQKREPDD